ncbi:Uncharacterized protein TCM_039295 [Theobroma cacao]|uniref:Uncharacterized protein n=1 Tax=Theobroma cacao TaxID=3641 RepID=A0A061GXS3_THECC|nr:Uncharacterized protein TCM_039295 [Theobroma cacao]
MLGFQLISTTSSPRSVDLGKENGRNLSIRVDYKLHIVNPSRDGGFVPLVIHAYCTMMIYGAYKDGAMRHHKTSLFALAMGRDMTPSFAATMVCDTILYVVCRLATVHDYATSRDDHSIIRCDDYVVACLSI